MAAALAVLFSLPAAASAATTVWAVGDGADGPAADTTDDQVGALIGAGPLDGFLYLGDVYSTGTQGTTSFREMGWYDDAYGAYKDLSYPTPGNHDWPTRSLSTGYDAYWPQYSNPHYYSFDIGGWHVISLNSEDAANPAQLAWLQNDLAENPGACTLPYWHKPRFAAPSIVPDTGNTIRQSSATDAFWQALSGHASLALAGHIHNYQRLKPLDAAGNVTTDGAGITEIIVGTGGEDAEHHSIITDPADPRLEYGNSDDFGALKMELEPGRADFEMVKLGGGVLDSGSVACKAKPRASTGAAAPDAPTSAALSGTVDPNGDTTTYRFEYGTTATYGSQTDAASAGASADPQPVRDRIEGLLPSTTYHYRLVATNSFGTTEGPDRTFTTPATLSVNIEGGPAGLTNQRMPTFAFSANEAVASFRCSIYQGTVVLGKCSGARTHSPPSPLADGAYIIRVTASDVLGQSASQTRTFTVDGTPPQTRLTGHPRQRVRTTSRFKRVRFEFSGADSAAGPLRFGCRLDGGSFRSCRSPFVRRVKRGRHRFSVRAIDAAGNADPTPASYRWRVVRKR